MKHEHSSTVLVLMIVVAICVIAGVMVTSTYNGLVDARESVDRSYADIGTQLQRRADLIPNLVQTVSGYMAHEQSIIDSVTSARERMMQTSGIPELAEADSQMSQALNSLLVIAENYPELKANENFIALSDELAGTENRIATTRRDYNAAAQRYNARIQKFPTVLLANMLGFDKAEYFQAAPASAEVPNVVF